MAYNLATDAKDVFSALTAGVNFTIPTVNLTDSKYSLPSNTELYEAVGRVGITDITDRQPGGDGTFDAMMEAFKNHLREEYDANRITGDQYTKAYIELASTAMSNATQFVLNREQTFWAAVVGQAQAITAGVALEAEKVRVSQAVIEANTVKANYALTVAKLGTEEVNYLTAGYNLDNILPAQKTLLAKQADAQTAQITVSGKQATLLDKQAAHTEEQTRLTEEQIGLVTEQTEVQRAQTMDTRLNGTTLIAGNIGKQKALIEQQITSYKRDGETKIAKILSDAWITNKTIDEGLTAPTNFQNSKLDVVFNKLLTNLQIT